MSIQKILHNEELSKYTTIRIGGIARNMYFPHGIEELKEACAIGTNYIIGGGSNLLIDNGIFEHVICLKEFDDSIVNNGDGLFRVGASVRLQKLIRTINENDFGGIEYLYSVPGLVGGAVVMNAGPGASSGQSISDYIEEVTVLDNGIVRNMKKDECGFSNRTSVFKNNSEYVVIYVTFRFKIQNKEISESLRKERIEFCKKTQDMSGPNFGSVFSVCNYRIMRSIQLLSRGNSTCAHYSNITPNWIINGNNNSFKSVYKLIQLVINIHKLFKKKCATEVIIWRK